MASKEEIKLQIAALQAKLAEAPGTPPAKRRRSDQGSLLAPATPSPRKRSETRPRSPTPANRTRGQPRTRHPSNAAIQKTKHGSNGRSKESDLVPVSGKASFLSNLKALNADDENTREAVSRTEGFEEKPAVSSSVELAKIPVRDEGLAIVEELVPGPVEHKAIADDPKFERIEPNSGIRLKERTLSHASLQDHLSGRYYLPPSLLYSVVRLQSNKQAYEVPVEGDWVTIAVVVERGDVKLVSGAANSSHGKRRDDENEDVFGEKNSGSSNKKRKKGEDVEDENTRKSGKKYVHLKLVDLGLHSRSYGSSSNSSRGSLRGDAQLSLLLFESDYFDKLIEKNGNKQKVRKIWRGGSGGAFEECFPGLREGTVIALLNPKVLKPFTNSKNPSPSSSVLALTPSSASAIAIIGIAADLGRCAVVRRDGRSCGSWVDRRLNLGGPVSKHTEDVCDYHIQTAVQRTRAARPEFSVGTSGMSVTAHKRKSAYDPTQHWGLKPEVGTRGQDGEATYVVGGLVASSGHSHVLGNVGSAMGREEQARARRKAGAGEDKVLAELLDKGSSRISGGSGGEASKEALVVVRKAREALAEAKERDKRDPRAVAKGEETATSVKEDSSHGESRRKTYSAEVVKHLGFDPTIKGYPGKKLAGKSKNADAVGKLGKLGSQNREIQLGPPPGPKVRSGVTVSHLRTKCAAISAMGAALVQEEGDDDRKSGMQPNRLSISSERKSQLPGMGSLSGLQDDDESDSVSDLEIEADSPRMAIETTPEVELECV